MGWRDINMNRRRPVPRVATVAVEPGGERSVAVMRKASAAASGAAAAQLEGAAVAREKSFRSFLTGYLLGFARFQAVKDGVDCEMRNGGMAELARELVRALPPVWEVDMDNVRFIPRPSTSAMPRTRLQLTLGSGGEAADAGYLVGHLEALCGSRRLLIQALRRMRQDGADSGLSYLTDCDVAADPMQTREPTLPLRFEGPERGVIIGAFG